MYNIENETGLSQSNAAALLLNMLSYGEMKNADAGLCKMAYNKLVKQNILVEMPTIYGHIREEDKYGSDNICSN